MTRICSAIALFAAGAGVASAGDIVQTGSIPLSATNWSETALIDQFDVSPAGRSLVAVEWALLGIVKGSAEVESLDSEAATVNLSLSSLLTMSLGEGSIASISPSIYRTIDLGAFDGEIDFAGPSGHLLAPELSFATASGVIEDVSPFLGEGQVALTFEALGASWGSGSGNLLLSLSTDASIDYQVVYRFTDVPTPGALALLGLAGALTAGRRRR